MGSGPSKGQVTRFGTELRIGSDCRRRGGLTLTVVPVFRSVGRTGHRGRRRPGLCSVDKVFVRDLVPHSRPFHRVLGQTGVYGGCPGSRRGDEGRPVRRKELYVDLEKSSGRGRGVLDSTP